MAGGFKPLILELPVKSSTILLNVLRPRITKHFFAVFSLESELLKLFTAVIIAIS